MGPGGISDRGPRIHRFRGPGRLAGRQLHQRHHADLPGTFHRRSSFRELRHAVPGHGQVAGYQGPYLPARKSGRRGGRAALRRLRQDRPVVCGRDRPRCEALPGLQTGRDRHGVLREVPGRHRGGAPERDQAQGRGALPGHPGHGPCGAGRAPAGGGRVLRTVVPPARLGRCGERTSPGGSLRPDRFQGLPDAASVEGKSRGCDGETRCYAAVYGQ